MITLSKVDGVLLKWSQEWSEYKQVTTDKNCYYFAAEVFKLMEFFSIYVPALLFVFTGFLVDTVFFLVSIAFSVPWYMLRSDRIEMRRIAKQTKKIPEVSQAFREISIILPLAVSVLMVPFGYVLVTSGFLLLTLLLPSITIFMYLLPVHFYLLSCSPLPPETLEFRRNARRTKKKSSVLQPQTA